MRNFCAALVCLVAFAHQTSFADVAKKPFAQSKKTAKTEKVDSEATEKRATQKGGKFGVAANGGILYAWPAFGIEGWYALSKQFHLGMNFLTSSGEVTASSDSATLLETMTLHYDAVGMKGRYFFTETFHGGVGLDYAMMTGDYGYKLNNSDAKVTYPFQNNALLLEASIGNTWQWANGFVLGVDWVGGFLFLSSSHSVDTANPTVDGFGSTTLADASDADDAEIKSKSETAVKKAVQLYLLMVRVGYRF